MGHGTAWDESCLRMHQVRCESASTQQRPRLQRGFHPSGSAPRGMQAGVEQARLPHAACKLQPHTRQGHATAPAQHPGCAAAATSRKLTCRIWGGPARGGRRRKERGWEGAGARVERAPPVRATAAPRGGCRLLPSSPAGTHPLVRFVNHVGWILDVGIVQQLLRRAGGSKSNKGGSVGVQLSLARCTGPPSQLHRRRLRACPAASWLAGLTLSDDRTLLSHPSVSAAGSAHLHPHKYLPHGDGRAPALLGVEDGQADWGWGGGVGWGGGDRVWRVCGVRACTWVGGLGGLGGVGGGGGWRREGWC